MANKPINALPALDELQSDDLFAVWDSSLNTAVKMSGQQMVARLTEIADGHGGISGIAKTGTSGLNDTYTISYADGTTFMFIVTNGAKGDTGDQTYVWIAYSATEPDSDSDMSVIPAPWMGIYVGLESTQGNLHYTDYTWYEIKGPKGDGVAYTAQTGEVGLTKTYTMYTADSTPVGSFSVTDGAGAVSTVNGIAPDGEGNVPTIVTSVEDLGLIIGSATIADAYAALQASQILFAPASDFAIGELPLVGGTRQTYGTIELIKADTAGSRGLINFYGKEAANKDFRMYLSANNVPSGTWLSASPTVDFTSLCTFPKGTPAHFSAVALGGLAVVSYQGPSTTYAAQDVLVRVPAEYAFNVATFGQQFNLCTFNTQGVGTVFIGNNNSGRDIIINGVPAGITGNTRCYFQIIYSI